MNNLNTAANIGPRARRMGALLLITLALMASFFGGTYVASGTRHRAGNGPSNNGFPPPPSANFGGFPYGVVRLNGAPVTDAVVAMGYNGREITTAVVSLPQFKDPLFMFDSRPARELSTTFGATAIFTAFVPGYTPVTTMVRLFPDQAGEVAVPFWIGKKPEIKPVPPPPSGLLSADAITNIVAAHQLDAGDFHTCVIVTGQLRCWGGNNYLQTGIGPPAAANYVRGRPAVVTGITETVRAVATGAGHTCVVLLSGRVQCFGHRWLYGATGTADPSAPAVTSRPVDVQGVANAVDVVAGEYVTCALVRESQNDNFTTRRVKCWGMNTSGQLGIGTADLDPHPTATYVLDAAGQPLENVTSVSAKGWHVCAVVAGGVQCWGLLLNPDLSSRVSPVPTSIIPAGSGITYVEVGHHNTCAIQVGGAVFCWGSILEPVSYSPVRFPELPTDVTKLAISRYAACALRAVGSVLCWGMGDYQQVFGVLGANATQAVTLPLPIVGITNAVDISLGEYHACVRLSDAGVKCWGTNSSGQIGDGTSPNYPYPWYTPLTVTAISQSAQGIVAGGYHTCANVAGVVRCWGANGYGQLGGGFISHLSLEAVTVTNLLPNVTMVTAGRQHSCALTAAGAVYCWGRNDAGQLGNGSEANSSRPVPVWGLDSGIKAIAAGEHHTCALRIDGTLLCWGSNWAGQLATSPETVGYNAAPVTVTGLAGKVSTFGLGDDHTCAVTEAGAAQCWGYNFWGQLGRGTFSQSSSQPITVTGLDSGVTAVAAGQAHTCAIVNSKVKCWGYGAAGQLGNNMPLAPDSYYSVSVPVDTVALNGAVANLNAGYAVSCAQRVTGETLCWGSGWTGQLGNGTVSSSYTPITVTALGSSATDLSFRSTHSCARLADGSLRCWGDNMYGQVGNGYSLIRPTPANVVDIAPAKWTYMLYLAGDNDLSFYLDNVADALNRLPQSPDLNIAVFFDGQGKDDSYIWSTRDGTFNKWRIEEAESRTSDAATLAQFIDWAHANFPAEHYYLSIADHGRGTTGIAFDTQNGTLEKPEALTPARLRQALAAATNNGLWQIDVLHFDACLMALLEVAYQVKDYAHYMIASENLTAALYPYDKYAQAVLDNPAITPRDLAVDIADQYYHAPYMLLNNYPRTISVLDLSQIGVVTGALDTLAGAMINNMGAVKADIAAARDRVQVFDASPDFTQTPPTYYTLTRSDEYIDLDHFAQLMSNSSNSDINTAAHALDTLLTPALANSFVVTTSAVSGVDRLVSGNNWDLSNSHGVGIYFPLAQNPADYPRYVNGGLFAFTAASQWDEFLKAYLSGTDATPLPDPGIPPVIQPMVPITTHCEGSQNCLWGTVYSDGLPLAGAAVTLAHANGIVESTSAVVAQNEFEPIFRFPLGTLNVRPGDRLTLTAVYSGTAVQRSLFFDPLNGEQEVPMLLQTTPALTDPTQLPVPVAAGVRWAIVYPQTVDRGQVSFTAEGATSDGSPIVAYRWTSNLDGDLGTSSSFNISSDRLQRGVHEIEVTAINNQGVESPPATIVLTVTAPGAARMELAQGQTVVPVGGEEVAIDVRVFDRQNIAVEDGTLVRATTTLGELVNPAAATKGGAVTFFLRSPNHPGRAVISLFAGEAKVETGITFMPAAAAQLVVQPSTPRLPSDGIATAFVSAVVADRFGNRVPNLKVSFATDLGTIEPLVVTDALGQARATYTTTTSVGVATITTTAGDLTAKTQIAIGGAYSLMLPMIARGE